MSVSGNTTISGDEAKTTTGGNEISTDTSDLAIVGMIKPNATAKPINPKNDFFMFPPPRMG
jgi:hypothetical protein